MAIFISIFLLFFLITMDEEKRKKITFMIVVIGFILSLFFNVYQAFLKEQPTVLSPEEQFKQYINNNVKGAMYITDNKSGYEKVILLVINNGSENYDKDLSFHLAFPNENYNVSKPESEENLSYYTEQRKPWVFGKINDTTVIWNGTLPSTTTLSKNGGKKWAIFYIEWNTSDIDEKFSFPMVNSIIIEDIYGVDVVWIKENPPDGNPRDWSTNNVLQNITKYE
jgi:hypothetical protein